MNHFEKLAVYTVIENIEGQLRGLKTLLAASGGADLGAKQQQNPVPRFDGTTYATSESEEQEIAAMMAGITAENLRKAQADQLAQAAAAAHGALWSDAATVSPPQTPEQ